MKTEARFVVRDSGDSNDGLIIGVRMKGSSLLKPGFVYEIQEVLGEAVLVEIGPSAVKRSLPDYEGKPYYLDCCWGQSMGHLLGYGKYVFMTEQEAEQLFPRRSE